jgi:WD40-like Beta Propeller Repeat
MERLRLEELPLPEGAEERAWAVVRAAYDERLPSPRARSRRPLAAVAVAAAALVAALSPPGRAVLDSIRESVGVERAAPALFSLPAPGRLLVESDSGAWVVSPDGSKRRLGDWREASWSPFGRFVVASRGNELAALEPNGHVRWTLDRPAIRFPRWGGSRTDTRIAYLTSSRLHVVAGDGTGDVEAGGLPAAARVAPAWRPGARHVVAYVDTRGRVHAYDAGAGSDFWAARPVLSAAFPRPRSLTWSPDGRRLLLVTASRVVLFGTASARPLANLRLPDVVGAAFAPDSRRLAVVRPREVLLLSPETLRSRQQAFGGPGGFTGAAWSPDGRWLLVAWRDADQWVFVRVAGGRRIRAVSDVSRQFAAGRFPAVPTWCCDR